MIKYITKKYSIEIEAVELERETKYFVVFSNGRKDSKRSDYSNYHNTLQEAKEYLLNIEYNKIASSEFDIKAAKQNIEKINKLGK